MTNPNTFSANSVTSTWQIYTMNANKEYIDGIYSGLKAYPDLIGKTALIQALSVDDLVVGRDTTLKIGLVTGSQMTTDAIIDLYFPDQFAWYRNNNDCAVTVGNRYTLSCAFSYYSSGFIYKVSIYNACPQQCSSDVTYYYEIPIKNRGDVYYTSSQWKVIARYEYIDVGMGVLTNPIKFTAETLTQYDVTNFGCNTIDQECSIAISFKPINHIPKRGQRGRIRIVIPSQITPQNDVCQLSYDKNTAGTQCAISGYTMIATHNQDSIKS